jgi:hypothetical protein
MKTTVPLVLLLLLGACAAQSPYAGRNLAQGNSMAETQAAMGLPAEQLVDAGGYTVWFYPTAPNGRDTWAARFLPEDKLVAMEQRLTKENIARVVPDKSVKKEVRELLGPPWKTYRTLDGREEWDYRVMVDMRKFDFLVRFDDDGVVHKAYLLHDPIYDAPGGRR